MKRIIYTLTSSLCFCLCLLSCKETTTKREVIDLEKFPMNFDVDAFYATMKSAVKDTLFENANGDRFSGTPVAFQNIMPKFTNDTLAYYGKTIFESIEMVEDSKGDFVSLFAYNESKGVEAFKQLLAYIEAKNGKPKVTEGYSFTQFYTYSWDLKDRELILMVKGKVQEYISTLLGIKPSDDSKPIDTVAMPIIITNIFIFNKKFDKEFTISKIKSGDFLYLEPTSFSSMYLEHRP